LAKVVLVSSSERVDLQKDLGHFWTLVVRIHACNVDSRVAILVLGVDEFSILVKIFPLVTNIST
jgi:hypothetical protein